MTTYYIATTGNDTTGNGSSATPWLTLAKFLASSSSGDTCMVAAGTYTLATATISNRTIIGPSATSLAVFDGAAANPVWTMQNTNAISNIRFTNVSATANRVFLLSAGTHSFSYCRFDNINVALSGNTTNGYSRGLFEIGGQITFNLSSCVFIDLLGNGSTRGYMITSPSTLSAITVAINIINTVVTSTTTGTNGFGGCFINNSFTLAYTPAIIFKNCILYNVSGQTVNLVTGFTISSFTTPSYSCFYNMSSVPSGTANTTSDPIFVDAPNFNFNLRPTSPCINTGTLV